MGTRAALLNGFAEEGSVEPLICRFILKSNFDQFFSQGVSLKTAQRGDRMRQRFLLLASFLLLSSLSAGRPHATTEISASEDGRNSVVTETETEAWPPGAMACAVEQSVVNAEDASVVRNATPRIRKSHPGMYPGVRPSESLRRKIADLEDSLPKWMHDFHVPGVSIAFIEDRQLVWSRGYGVRCAGSESQVRPTTVMEACSMSKPFFAYLFLQLVQEKQADLDRPLVEYLGKDYLKDEPRHKKITARMVLSHTTGLPNWRRGGWGSGGPISLAFDPGTRFRYSGEGFLMLQRAVESIADAKLDPMSQERLINPLGLKHTRYVWDDRLMVEAACGHDRDGEVKASRKYYRSANAAYTLYTSAEDYARFLVEIMATDRTQKHSLSSQMVDQMLTPNSHREEQNADWGLGWGLRNATPNGDQPKLLYHNGSNGTGFRCHSEFQPERGTGLVIMTNAIGGKELYTALVEQWHAAEE